MGLNKSTGDMYQFVTHTWNPIKGKCFHGCSYCYMNEVWEKVNKHCNRMITPPPRLDDKELKTVLGSDNIIFIGSSCDMFANDIPDEWIKKVLKRVREYPFSKYLFQSKNPKRILDFICPSDNNFMIGTTIETNRIYTFMGNTPTPVERASALDDIHTRLLRYWLDHGIRYNLPLFITIEPILDFDLDEFVYLLKSTPATKINIGADSGNNNLPEPTKEKVLELIKRLEYFTEVIQKKNMRRLVA